MFRMEDSLGRLPVQDLSAKDLENALFLTCNIILVQIMFGISQH